MTTRCKPIVSNGKVVGFACGRRPTSRCSTPGCTRPGELLCDYPITRRGRVGTCDRRICSKCAFARAPGVDYCAAHAREHERTERAR